MANSVNNFQGLSDGEKNSSRVLAPPGGKSSNIFGAPEESQDRGSSHSAASSKRNDSTVFGAPVQENVNRVHRKDDDSQSTIFGSTAPEPANATPVKAKGREDSNIFGNSAAPAGLNANSTTKSVAGGEPYQRAATSPRLPNGPTAGYIRNQGEFKNPITHAEHTNDFGGASGERQPSANPQKAHYSQQGGFNPITGAAYGDSGNQAAPRNSTRVLANPGGSADTRPW